MMYCVKRNPYNVRNMFVQYGLLNVCVTVTMTMPKFFLTLF